MLDLEDNNIKLKVVLDIFLFCIWDAPIAFSDIVYFRNTKEINIIECYFISKKVLNYFYMCLYLISKIKIISFYPEILENS
jgi:hypothetical protein